MKKISWSFLLVIATLATSCDEWLDIEPENEQISSNYWQSKEEVEAVLGAGYATLRGLNERFIALGEARGGSLAVISSDSDLRDLYRWNITPQNDYCKWGKFYELINYANSVIQFAPDVVRRDNSFNESVMESFLSEAYFLRALGYFYLVRNFGEVPIVTEAYVNDDQQFEITKSSEEEIFALIMKDLRTAKDAAKTEFPELWETKGRATRWAIRAALADVYLWVGEYDLAIFELDEIINSGDLWLEKGIGPDGENQWFEIFSEGNTFGSIFELQFDDELAQRNDLRAVFEGEGSTNADYSLGAPLFVEFLLEPDDLRGIGASFRNENNASIWKYIGAAAGGTLRRDTRDQNFILYRMADVYLMKAEALAMKGTTYYDEATEIVNDIRLRANLTIPLATPGDPQAMLKMILDERAKEFVGEGKRWYDLLRVAKRNDYEQKELVSLEILLGAPASSSALIQSKLFDNNSLYLPIHFDELQANPSLVQNPYYDALN